MFLFFFNNCLLKYKESPLQINKKKKFNGQMCRINFDLFRPTNCQLQDSSMPRLLKYNRCYYTSPMRIWALSQKSCFYRDSYHYPAVLSWSCWMPYSETQGVFMVTVSTCYWDKGIRFPPPVIEQSFSVVFSCDLMLWLVCWVHDWLID